ncbi:MAG TPA: cytochrome c-type biogenesis protein CcmH [Thermoanaerobaculia bacterium]|nr:cytochrome c-type biogenesis protein CcmH [Thermoanaerobaculia bacterium]
MTSILLTLLLLGTDPAADVRVPDAEQLVGAPRGAALAGDALDRRTEEVASEIRCPVCQGLSVAASPSEMAVNMKTQVRALLARGYSEEQIEAYFAKSYGEFALLRPKFQGVNVLVWLLPLAALVAGIVVLQRTVRRLTSNDEIKQETVPPDLEEDPYLARVSELLKEGTR